MQKVIVSIKDGMVIDVEAPDFLDVVIRDYDVEGVADKYLKRDKDGDLYRETIW